MKELDKNALLEEAIRRFPLGTKYRVKEYTTGKHYLEGVVSKTPYWGNNGREDIISGYNGILWSSKHGWSEPIEEPKVETKFEKGKWYKINNAWYAKHECIHGSGRYWRHGDRITVHRDFHNKPGNLGDDWKDVSIVLLTDLSEIQQYLPDGHPDLIKEEFVLPEYWFLRFKTKEVFDELCKKYAPDFIFFENAGICNNSTKLKLGNYYYLTKDTKYGEEITFEQFKKYVLKEEVKEEVKPNITWKIGDYVVFTEDWCRSRKGDIDKIKKLGDGVTALHLEKEGLAGSPLYEECKLKIFPTLQEAQKFSDELLGKSKTNLNVEDLIEGEIYYLENKGWTAEGYIFIKTIYTRNNPHVCIGALEYSKNGWDFWNDKDSKNFRLATPSEKKWLKTCIKQDKFIPKEELDKYDDEGNLIEVKACVKCNTEQEFDFAAVKLNCTQKRWFLSNGHNCINLDAKNHSQSEKHYKDAGYIIYSFDEWLELYNYKEAYKAQFKKDEKFKDGDWLVYIKDCGFSPSTPIKIGDVRQMIRGSFGSLTIYGDKDLSQYFRKALPHEISVENSTIITGDYDAGNLVNLLKPLSTLDYNPIYKWQLEGEESKKKTPNLIDKTKVKVEIKRTKVKQIKL